MADHPRAQCTGCGGEEEVVADAWKATATAAPSLAICQARALPIPPLPPVTFPLRPASVFMVCWLSITPQLRQQTPERRRGRGRVCGSHQSRPPLD